MNILRVAFVAVVVGLVAAACGRGASPASPSSVSVPPESPAAAAGSLTLAWRCVRDGSCVIPAAMTADRGTASSAPVAPTALSASVSGSMVTLSWDAPVSGDAATSYVLEAGSAAGLTDVAAFVPPFLS